jgi:hypothetical protein
VQGLHAQYATPVSLFCLSRKSKTSFEMSAQTLCAHSPHTVHRTQASFLVNFFEQPRHILSFPMLLFPAAALLLFRCSLSSAHSLCCSLTLLLCSLCCSRSCSTRLLTVSYSARPAALLALLLCCSACSAALLALLLCLLCCSARSPAEK